MESGVNDTYYQAEARLISNYVAQGHFLGQIAASCM
jgi:hypothetical protein